MIDKKKLIDEVDYYISHTREKSGEHYAYKKAKELIERQPTVEAIPKQELRQLVDLLEDGVEKRKKEAYKATDPLSIMVHVEVMKALERDIYWIKNFGGLNEKV